MGINIDIDRFKEDSTLVVSESFVANVFMWMCAALGITALTAYFFGTTEELLNLVFKQTETGGKITIFGWIAILAPVFLVYFMSRRVNKLRLPVLVGLFLLYSVLMGLSLSFIFTEYTETSIFRTFGIAAGMFGTMAIIGYFTKRDLSKMASMITLALIGLIIAMVINIFLHSATFDYIISIIGVVLFTGITAYDMQTIKKIGMVGFENHETMAKTSIQAAITIYLDIINLFLYLLRFFGRRR